MSLQDLINTEIKPNVTGLGSIKTYPADGEGILHDVGVYITVNADGLVNRATQPVYEINGQFHLGRKIAKNYVAPEVTQSPEEKLVEYLDGLVGENGYTIHTPIDTTSGKAAVVTIGNEKKVIASNTTGYTVRNFA